MDNDDDDDPGLRVPERLRYKPMGAAYQGAMEAILSIVIGVIAGYFADKYLETQPWGLITGATIGFAAFVLRLSRLGTALGQAPGPNSEPVSASDRGAATAMPAASEPHAGSTEQHGPDASAAAGVQAPNRHDSDNGAR